jgi:hypothetical protein
VAAHVREDQLAVVVNVVAVVMGAAAVAVPAGMSVEAEAEAEIEDRSRVRIQRTAKASFFMKCVPQKQKGCDRSKIEDRSLFRVVSHSFWS